MTEREAAIELFRACQVIRLTEKTRVWLLENDPKALEQLTKAVKAYETLFPELKSDTEKCPYCHDDPMFGFPGEGVRGGECPVCEC